jgi:hypothetical protein
VSGNHRYKAVNHNHNISVDTKLHSINRSIEHSSLTANERPSSVTESLRYSKQGRKVKKVHEDSKDFMSTSIDVPSIELHNQDRSLLRISPAPDSMVYQKAAELIAQNFHKNMGKIAVSKTASNSQKILRSTSRSGKSKKSKIKTQFKKNASGIDKSLPIKKEQMHRKSKSDAKKMGEDILRNSNNNKANSKYRKSNYAEQFFLDKGMVMPKGLDDRESPVGQHQQYMLGHIGQNWIENINNQIELNGKNLLDSISKAKQK